MAEAMLLERAVMEAAEVFQSPRQISEAEFNDLYAELSGDLWRYIARITGDATLSDDIFQKAFFRFLRNKPDPDERALFRPLLYRIATNLVIDHWRHEKRQRNWLSAVAPVAPYSQNPEFGRDVRRLLGQMKPQERALLWLAHVEEQSHADIATLLGVGGKSVRVLLFRARKRFADLLRKHGISAEVLS